MFERDNRDPAPRQSLLGRLFGFIWGLVVTAYRLVFILVFVIFGVLLWLAFQGGKPIQVEDNIALIVAPTGFLVEQTDQEPSQQLLEDLSGDPPSQSRLRDVIEALERGAEDRRISFAVVKLDGLFGAGLPQMEEVAAAIRKFRESGKKVVAYAPWYGQDQYYAAAQADEIVMDPQGFVEITGFSVYTNFFKDALDKLGVAVNVFRVGEYKAAVEPFLRNDMSPEAKAANLEWLGDLWSDYGKSISAARKLPETAARDYVANLATGLEANRGDAAAYAKAAGLVTHVETLKEFRARMAKTVGLDPDHGSFRQINYHEYLQALHQNKGQQAAPQNQIALVVVQGEIVEGGGEQGYAGGDTIADLLDQARRDDDVVAVVLRVDSPGGSVWASEQIRREVQHLREDGKPVIASMSSVAASGGYWVSMDADEIWAHNTTVTGSIGIFGLIPTVDKPLGKLGIHTDGVGTTPLAGALRMDRPISPEWSSIIQSSINKGYQDFISGVAQARKLPVEKVNEIARGRVWSGADAKTLGLVDHIGGLGQAVEAAAQRAGLEAGDYELQEFAPDLDWADRLISRFSGGASLKLPQGALAWLQALAERSDVNRMLRWLNDPQGMYAHCFCRPSGSGRLP